MRTSVSNGIFFCNRGPTVLEQVKDAELELWLLNNKDVYGSRDDENCKRVAGLTILLMLPMLNAGRLIFIVAIATFNIAGYAQDLEPRAYANTPVGMNFLVVGYRYSDGALLFDPALPIENAHAKVNMGLLAYARTLGIAGKSAKASMLLPYADLAAEGYIDGVYRTRDTAGIADPGFLFTINLFGAPALSLKDFKDYRQNTIIGFTFKLTAPWGVYDKGKVINIGTNRWSFKPEFGISRAIRRWTLEGAAAATFYTANNNFDNDKTRQQDPIYSLQGNVIYSFPNQVWAAIGATYYTGGRTTIDGVLKNDLQQNWRVGFAVALPIDRHHSIKVSGSSGVSTRTGTDYDAIGIAWQYRWAQGF